MKTATIMLRCMVKYVMVIFSAGICYAQNDVMLQAFYWNVPIDTLNTCGTWWNVLRSQTPELKNAGFTALWVPPPSKGNWGISDVGYGIYDHYDLGNYDQKGSIGTHYGSKKELLQSWNNGKQKKT